MYTNKHFKIILLLMLFMIAGCNSETAILNKEGESIKKESAGTYSDGGASDVLLEVSYEKTSYMRYVADYEKLTELDMAHINPSDEKQSITMALMQDGTVNMTIEEMDFEPIIKIPHKVLPSDVPKIKRTEIIGNHVTFYDGSRNMLGSHTLEIPKNREMAEQIKQLGDRYDYNELANAFSTMQGDFFEKEMDKVISDAEARGQLIVHNENYATVRMNFADVKPGATGSSVMLIDRKNNKVMASTHYDEQEKITSRTLFNYAKEGPPILNSVRSEVLLEMPSGAEVVQMTTSKIENLKFNLKQMKQ